MMKKRLYAGIVMALIAALLIAGCSAPAVPGGYGGNSKDNAAVQEAESAPMPAATEAPQYDEGSGVAADITGDLPDMTSILQPGVNRKVIYYGEIEAKTKNFDDDYNRIMSSLRSAGGYVQSSSIEGTKPEKYGDPGRTANLTLRIPSVKFDSFFDMLRGIGNNVRSSSRGEDVSLQYYDTEQQLETLRTRQQRLQEMMKNPNYPLADLIQVEKELSQVSHDIQQLETTKRSYDSLIDFSSVNVSLQEINTIGLKNVPETEPDLGTQISNGFFGVLKVLSDIGRGLLIFITAGSPALATIAVIVAVVVLIVKRSKKKKMKKAAQLPPQGGNNNGQNQI